jgi:two-component system, cell cycle response regulator DivK
VSTGSGLQRYTIMVAEDFGDTRQLLRKMLESYGYQVVEAADGQEAVELVWQQCPDLILMDLNMPLLDGLAATEQIRQCKEVCKDVTILAITAHDTYGMKEAALEAGCDGYLTKPIDFDHLRTIIDRILVSQYKPTEGATQL